MTTQGYLRRSVSHLIQVCIVGIGVACLSALCVAAAAQGVTLPDAAKSRVQPALLVRATSRVNPYLLNLSRVTCPGPEQMRLSRNWLVKPAGESAITLPPASRNLAAEELGRVKPVIVKIPTVEFPRPAIIPDIKPSWEPQNVEGSRFQWGAAIRQSLRFLAIQHAFRLLTEDGTRRDLKGPFFKDYFETVSKLRGWRDGDPFIVNYIGHPMMGAVTGYIQIHNDPRGLKQEVGFSKEYFKSRLKAFGWSALYSTQFEIGPISEASLGNVGIRPTKLSRHPMGYVDLVVTPVVGTAWLVGEDALDKYVVLPLESRIHNKTMRILVRSFLNPSRSMANVLRSKWPWYRDDRRL